MTCSGLCRSSLRSPQRPSGLKSARRTAAPRPPRRSLALASSQSDDLRNGVQAMLRKYDFLSTGVGALAVTSYCVVYKHQDPVTALQITAASVVVGLVLNELIFEQKQ